MPDDYTCEQFQALSAELALGVLDGAERAATLAHLQNCPACQEDLGAMADIADRLVEITPAAEPPAGFETRVLAAVGAGRSPAQPAPTPETGTNPEATGTNLEATGTNLGAARTILGAAGAAVPPSEVTGLAPVPAGPTPDGGAVTSPHRGRPTRQSTGNRSTPRRAGSGAAQRADRRPRRAVLYGAVAAVVAAVIGVGGWVVGHHSGPATPATRTAGGANSAPVSATLVSDHQALGQAIVIGGAYPWMSMSVDTGLGDRTVTCVIHESDGRTVTIGSFALDNGFGYWAAPITGPPSTVTSAQLVDATGSTLATATFTTP